MPEPYGISVWVIRFRYVYCTQHGCHPVQRNVRFCCRAFTLVGDHYQLPPLVTSRAAEEGGLGVSLFKRLCEAHPQVCKRQLSQSQLSIWPQQPVLICIQQIAIQMGCDHHFAGQHEQHANLKPGTTGAQQDLQAVPQLGKRQSWRDH